MNWPFDDLERGKYGASLADPPWQFFNWSCRPWWERKNATTRAAERHYETESTDNLCALPVSEIAAPDCVLFLWMVWPSVPDAMRLIEAWGFTFKTCAFCWTKAHAGQIEMFEQSIPDQMGLGYWTRANTEACLLATRGKPRRLAADVRQAIIEPRRQHSRKPNCIHGRIERLVAGPYVELFARQKRQGWDCWGNQTDKFAEAAE